MGRGQPGAGSAGGCVGRRGDLQRGAADSPAVKFDLYTRLYLWLASHRRLVLVAMLLITAVSMAVSSRIDLEEDILGILPQRDQTVDDYKYALRKFRQIDRVYLDVGLES